MRLFKIFIAFFLIAPVAVFSQTSNVGEQDLTGVWKGALYNDTTQQFLAFEIAVSKEKGKLVGYSYTQFENTDKTEWIVKKIKIKQKGEQLFIEDVEHVSHTFDQPPPRGVRWIGIVDFYSDDTSLQLQGKWSTTRTKEYSPATGSIHLQRKSNYRPLTIYKRLRELDLDESLSFVIADQNNQDVAVNTSKPAGKKPVEIVTVKKTKPDDAKVSQQPPKNTSVKTGNEIVVKQTTPASNEGVLTPAKSETVSDKSVPGSKTNDVAGKSASTGVKPGSEAAIIVKKNDTATQSTVAKQKDLVAVNTPPLPGTQAINVEPKKPASSVRKPPVDKDVVVTDQGTRVKEQTGAPANAPTQSSAEIAINKVEPETPTISSPPPVNRVTNHNPDPIAKTNAQQVNTTIKPITMTTTSAAANVSKRTISNTQEVFYQSDSLILSLYDNGEVDGDTVSVLLNGNIIFAKQGLTTKANSKVIYISPDTPDSLLLVMYAENLGTIPPNTGLLVVRDGDAVYDVRFRADLQSNAAIILRRKRR